MFFFQPNWLQHGAEGQGKQPIFSVDLQAVGNRLATAGQDCRVRIWSCEALIKAGSLSAEYSQDAKGGQELVVSATNSAAQKDKDKEKAPKGALLAVLAYHAGAVNCVRFSPDGHFLASGGDDSVVLTYERLAGAGRAAFGSSEEEIENWRCRRPLRAHLGDVTDLSWCSDSDRFCSGSVDNTIYIWSAKAEKALVKLEGHKGLVKGVAWDPIGKFIASQSDDRSVIIWRTSDWKIEKKLTAPFADAVLHENNLAFFLRLNWSPCGSLLLTTNGYAKKTATHLAPMFSRETSLSDHVDFIGHSEPIVVGKFSPRLYCSKPLTKEAEGTSKENPAFACVALGSKDRGASLWRAGSAKPFATLQAMFNSDVVDIAWGADGYTLVACSTDGGVMVIRFSAGELGHVIPDKIEQQLFKEMWQSFGGKSAETQLPENKVQVSMEAKASAAATQPVSPDVKSERQKGSVAAATLPTVAPTEPQIVQPRSKKHESAKPVNSGPSATANAEASAQPTVIELPQREERVKGGKRRIIPQAIGTAGDGVVDASNQSMGMSWPAAPNSSSQQNNLVSAAPPAKRSRSAQGAGEFVGLIAANDSLAEMRAWISETKQKNVLPGAGRRGGAKCRAIDNASPPTLLEATVQSGSKTSMICCTRSGTVLWRDYIGSIVVALAGMSGKYAMVASADAFLYIYSAKSGRRLLPPISQEAPPHIMDLFEIKNKVYLLIVTRTAHVSIYDLEDLSLVVSINAITLLLRVVEGDDEDDSQGDQSGDYLRRGISVASISENVRPILVLSDGHAFVHEPKLSCWMRVADDHAPNSDFYRLVPAPGDDSLLSKMQAGAAMTARKRGAALLPSANLKRAAVEGISHLETLMASAIGLGSLEQYKHYLRCYSMKLSASEAIVESGDTRLRELCEMLCEHGEILVIQNSNRHSPRHQGARCIEATHHSAGGEQEEAFV